MAKGAQVLHYKITLLAEEARIFRDTNIALAKRRRASKTRVQYRGALSLEDSKAFIVFKTKGKHPAPNDGENVDSLKRARTTLRRCSVCGETGHNARICSKNVELSSKSESDET